MDELPPNAKQLLALARTADEPDDAARERVRRGVALAIGAAGVASAASTAQASIATKVGIGLNAAAKVALAGAITFVVGAAVWGLRAAPAARQPATPMAKAATPSAPARVAVPEQKPALQPAPQQPAPEQPASPAVQGVPARALDDRAPSSARVERHVRASSTALRRSTAAERAAPADDNLRAEMTILHDASAALDRGDLARARALLKAHREQYPAGQLRLERGGLEALTRCAAGEAGAIAAARAYLRAVPDGVLSARVASLCKLEQAP